MNFRIRVIAEMSAREKKRRKKKGDEDDVNPSAPKCPAPNKAHPNQTFFLMDSHLCSIPYLIIATIETASMRPTSRALPSVSTSSVHSMVW